MIGKKLYKSRDNRMISGVCAGIAEYFNMDPTIIRLAWVLFSLLGGSAGAWAGMYLFHHKTKHWYFVVGMPLILAAQLAAGVWLAGNSGLV